MRDTAALRVAIDARMTPQTHGGVAHATRGLIHGLGVLGGDEQYVVIIESDEQRDWITPDLGPNQTLVDQRRWNTKPAVHPQPTASLIDRAKQRVKRSVRAWSREPRAGEFVWPAVDVSAGYFESLECDVMHFPSQRYTLCALPCVYNPHDLQHLHYPQFFTAQEVAWREVTYRAGCRLAQCVMVGSAWIKDDIVSWYHVDPNRVQVIAEGAPTQFATRPDEATLRAVRERFELRDRFALYPATTWPHKNHVRLMEAVHLVRSQGVDVQLVCPGPHHEVYWPAIERARQSLDLAEHVIFPGFVSERELAALYALAGALVLPSLFEASSLPIYEAWYAGVPVASSNATALPEQTDDAALLFDPMDVGSIADALRRVLTDEGLRATLRARGTTRLGDFDWRRTAASYRAVYRRTAGRSLTEEDRWLLSRTSMRDAGPMKSAT